MRVGPDKILVSEHADATASAFVVCGAGMGLVCQLRGLVTLHATTLQVGNHAVAIAGPSGAGKSTLAYELVRRGHRLISDDVTAIDVDGSALVGFGTLKLLRGPIDTARFPTVLDPGGDKIAISAPRAAAARPLSRIVFAARGPFGHAGLDGSSLLLSLLAHGYCTSLPQRGHERATAFVRLSSVASRAAAVRLVRGDRADLPKAVALIEAFCT